MSTYDTTEIQKKFGPRIITGELLGRYTTFKIGGPADVFFDAKTTEELVECYRLAHASGIPVFILGGGTNILISDKGIRGLVIKNSASRIGIRGVKGVSHDGTTSKKVYVTADSGAVFNRLVRFTLDEGLAGFEMHLGLPGTVGGAMYMNSKWMHPEGYAGDRVYQADILLPGGTVTTQPKSYFQFGYDYSIVQKSKEIILSCTFELDTGNKEALWSVANDSIAYRRNTQPQGIFTAGCVFKNLTVQEAHDAHIPGLMTSAGYLVDKAGLKGESAGEAQISTVHANFIANKGRATASDVLQLITRAHDAVYRKFGVDLREEIIRVGEF